MALLCGGGGALAAAGAAGWWYATQPDRIAVYGEGVTVIGGAPASLPMVMAHRRLGDAVPAIAPLTWTVEPASLARVEGEQLVAQEAGEGLLQACLGKLCDSTPLTVAMADTIVTTPEGEVAFRVWSPRTVTATPKWRGAPASVPLTWSVADARIATVTDAGLLTPVAAGRTELRIEGGDAVTTLSITIHPEPAEDCTLSTYADVVGRTGTKQDSRHCMEDAPDFCEWNARQDLIGGGAILEGGGWEWGWTTLELPDTPAEEGWELARRCMNLPPEVAALDLPALLRERRGVHTVIPLAGDWDVERAAATIDIKDGSAQIELPSACYDNRTFAVHRAGKLTLTTSSGC